MKHRSRSGSELRDDVSNSRRMPRSWRVFALALVVFFGVAAVWSAATPLLAAPDEPSQIVKAAAVVHGRLSAVCFYVPNTTTSACNENTQGALGFETLPAFYDLVRAPDSVDNGAHSQICFKNQKNLGLGVLPASCARSLNTPATASEITLKYNQNASTYQARYPPLYYAVVGLPSLFRGSTIDVYLMRMLSSLISAIFLALALTAVVRYSRNRALLIGVMLATTPMVFFLAGVVNSSGLEITAAIASWTCGVVLVTERLAEPPLGLIVMFTVAAVVLELVRPLSPLWLGLIVLVLLTCGDRRELTTAMQLRSLRISLGMLLVFGALALWWIVAMHATDLYLGSNPGVPASVSIITILETAFRHNSYYLPDMVGVFGWFDTYAPLATYVMWTVMLLAIVITAAVRSLRAALTLGCFVIAITVLPPVIEASHAHLDGYTWSGRDLLPFAVGLPIVAAAMLWQIVQRPGRSGSIRVTRTMIVGGAAANFLAFYEALRRYSVGTHGSIFGFILHPDWHPALGIPLSLGLGLSAVIALAAIFMWSSALIGGTHEKSGDIMLVTRNE